MTVLTWGGLEYVTAIVLPQLEDGSQMYYRRDEPLFVQIYVFCGRCRSNSVSIYLQHLAATSHLPNVISKTDISPPSIFKLLSRNNSNFALKYLLKPFIFKIFQHQALVTSPSTVFRATVPTSILKPRSNARHFANQLRNEGCRNSMYGNCE